MHHGHCDCASRRAPAAAIGRHHDVKYQAPAKRSSLATRILHRRRRDLRAACTRRAARSRSVHEAAAAAVP